ncbi:MAG: hypothetical protein MK193_09140 [Lentisphaeria bacterium]|nr:hypothetical protein [Lentisphaeria bacterium]
MKHIITSIACLFFLNSCLPFQQKMISEEGGKISYSVDAEMSAKQIFIWNKISKSSTKLATLFGYIRNPINLKEELNNRGIKLVSHDSFFTEEELRFSLKLEFDSLSDAQKKAPELFEFVDLNTDQFSYGESYIYAYNEIKNIIWTEAFDPSDRLLWELSKKPYTLLVENKMSKEKEEFQFSFDDPKPWIMPVSLFNAAPLLTNATLKDYEVPELDEMKIPLTYQARLEGDHYVINLPFIGNYLSFGAEVVKTNPASSLKPKWISIRNEKIIIPKKAFRTRGKEFLDSIFNVNFAKSLNQNVVSVDLKKRVEFNITEGFPVILKPLDDGHALSVVIGQYQSHLVKSIYLQDKLSTILISPTSSQSALKGPFKWTFKKLNPQKGYNLIVECYQLGKVVKVQLNIQLMH